MPTSQKWIRNALEISSLTKKQDSIYILYLNVMYGFYCHSGTTSFYLYNVQSQGLVLGLVIYVKSSICTSSMQCIGIYDKVSV